MKLNSSVLLVVIHQLVLIYLESRLKLKSCRTNYTKSVKLSNTETKNYSYECDQRFSNEKDRSEHVKTWYNYPCLICGKK